MLTEIQGDLLKLADAGEFDTIVHGCNCFCTMGAGIAAAIRRRWPRAYDADLCTAYGEANKLGTRSEALVDTSSGGRLLVVNAYTQYRPGGGEGNFRYEALERVLFDLEDRPGVRRLGMPRIGCGIAGASWERVRAIVSSEFINSDVHATIVEYAP